MARATQKKVSKDQRVMLEISGTDHPRMNVFGLLVQRHTNFPGSSWVASVISLYMPCFALQNQLASASCHSFFPRVIEVSGFQLACPYYDS